MIAPTLLAALLLVSRAKAEAAPMSSVAEQTEMIQRGDYRGALRSLSALLKREPGNVPARLAAAAACVGVGDPSCAEVHLKWVREIAPETPGYQLLLGRTLLLRADWAAANNNDKESESLSARAVDAFSEALQVNPGDAKTIGFRAMALQGAGRTAEAREAYDAWITTSPRDPGAYGAAATLLAGSGAWSDAQGLIDRAPKDDPALLHSVRFAVVRGGVGVVPWPTIQPLFDEVTEAEPDLALRGAMQAYSAIMTRNAREFLLATLTYLDGDPADRLDLKAKLGDDDAKLKDALCVPEKYGRPVVALKKITPTYPEIAQEARVEGRVVLLVRVRKDGSIGTWHVLARSNPIFDRAAIDSVRKWRYEPVVIDGQAIEFPFIITVDFRLN